MLCFVTQPNSVVLEVEVDNKAKGQECLDKVCQILGILEPDYFGIRYTGTTGETYWINRRNEIRNQVPGSPPYRLQLRVKFYIPPHLLLHDTTRYLFYISIKHDYIEGILTTNDLQALQMTALIAQAETGDLSTSGLSTVLMSYKQWYPKRTLDSEAIVLHHHLLEGTKQSTARYRLIQVASDLPDFGIEYFKVKNSEGFDCKFGVGPRGVVVVYERKRIVIPFTSVLMASQSDRCFFLTFMDSNNYPSTAVYKCKTWQTSNAIYRLVTETHSFYSCETVTHAVLSQHVRDLKGTIVSIFNEHTSLGKNYVFDVTRTFRQVYDDTRRLLHRAGVNSDNVIPEVCTDKNTDVCGSSQCKELQHRFQKLQDSLLCHLCMDSNLDCVFSPCRHAVCCQSCANLCSRCPVCRTEVESFNHIYLPLE